MLEERQESGEKVSREQRKTGAKGRVRVASEEKERKDRGGRQREQTEGAESGRGGRERRRE